MEGQKHLKKGQNIPPAAGPGGGSNGGAKALEKGKTSHLPQTQLVHRPGNTLHVAPHALEIHPHKVPVPRATKMAQVRRCGVGGGDGGIWGGTPYIWARRGVGKDIHGAVWVGVWIVRGGRRSKDVPATGTHLLINAWHVDNTRADFPAILGPLTDTHPFVC